MAPKKSTIVLNVEQFIHDVEQRPAIWNRNFHCNKAFLEQMWDELSSQHKLPKVILKAKWKGLRDNFRVEYKRIPRADNGDFLVEPPSFESKWIHYYALLFLSEVYVLDDGGEVDLDLGNYERFLDITLHRDNNITTGKIYSLVIQKERTGEYLGKTVQVVPHITDAIQEWVERVAQNPVRGSSKPQVCIVELGGTIGDIEGMPFVEAFRQFQFRVKRENFCVAHVSLVPSPRTTGEPKTKPTQSSVRELRGFGLSPDLIVCRSEKPIGQEVKEKISNFCHVAPDQVICVHDLSTIYHVPLLMEQNGVIEFLNERLQLNIETGQKCLQQWKDLAHRTETLRKEVVIAIVGKYTKLEDSYASVVKALQHASLAVGYKLNLKFIEACHLELPTRESKPSQYHEAWQLLCNSHGVVVPGGFGSRGMEGKIIACNWCRKKRKPFLGICLGLQAAVIEFARNELGLTDANTTEIDVNTEHPLVIDMPEHHNGLMGGTMRLGRRTTVFSEEQGPSIIRQLYGNPKTIDERHRHRYEVNPKYVSELEKRGMKFVGCDIEKTRMEIVELQGHPYYVAVQYHPEYLSRPLKPSPPFLGLILASVGRLKTYISRGCRLSPRQQSDASSDDEEAPEAKILKTMNMNGNGSPTGHKHLLPNGLALAKGEPRSSNTSDSEAASKANGPTTTATVQSNGIIRNSSAV